MITMEIRNLKAEYSQLCAKLGKETVDDIYRSLAHAVLQLIGDEKDDGHHIRRLPD